jgi:hypothetical protein
MVKVYWQCSKNTSPGPYFCLYEFETEEVVCDGNVTSTCPLCGNHLTIEDVIEQEE